MSNSTRWFSSSERYPSLWIAEKCTKTSGPPPSCSMKPKPFSALNHFTVPCAMGELFPSSRQVSTNGEPQAASPLHQRDKTRAHEKSPPECGRSSTCEELLCNRDDRSTGGDVSSIPALRPPRLACRR